MYASYRYDVRGRADLMFSQIVDLCQNQKRVNSPFEPGNQTPSVVHDTAHVSGDKLLRVLKGGA